MKRLISAIFATVMVTSCVSKEASNGASSGPKKSKTEHRSRSANQQTQPDQAPVTEPLVDIDSTVLPNLGSNFSTFHTQGSPIFKDDSAFCLESTQTLEEKELNFQVFDEGLKTINLSCLHLILGGSESNEIYNRIRKTVNVKKLVLLAETLEINDLIHIAGGDVEIRAKRVIFGRDGAISTTPESLTERANLKTDGKDGLAAGNISIFADEITDNENPYSTLRLITNGGNGQEAGPGIDGKPGKKADTVLKRTNITFYQVWQCRSQGSFGSSNRNCFWQVMKKGKPSTDGSDATVGGAPGAAGSAGQIDIQSAKYARLPYSSKPGLPGKLDSVRTGGAAGKPATTCKRMVAQDGKVADYDCVTAQKGQDALPKKPKTVVSEAKALNFDKDETRSYLTTELLSLQNKYAKMLFLNGHTQQAQEQYQTIDKQLKGLELIGEKFSAQSSVAEANLLKLDANRDYFGNEITWTPNIAFDMNFAFFKQEIIMNLKQVYLSRAILSKVKNVDVKRKELNNLKDFIADSIDEQKQKIHDAIEETSKLKAIIEGIKVSEAELKYEVKKLEKEFANEARNNLEPGPEEKMLGTIKILSNVIPVGQPTFRTVGFGIQLLQDMRKPGTNFEQVADRLHERFGDIESMNTQVAWKKLSAKLASFSVDDFNSANAKVRVGMLKDFYEFSAPIYKALKQNGNLLGQQEAPKNEVEAEIARIRNSSKRFKRVMNALGKLHASKKLFLQTYNNTKLSIAGGLAAVNSSFQKIAQINDHLEETSLVKSSELNSLLKEIESDNLERIDYYHYLLAKTYEYHFLAPYNKKFNHVMLADKIQRLIEANNESTGVDLKEILVFVTDEISAITFAILRDVSNGNTRFTQEKKYDFSEVELAQLSQGKSIYLDLTKFFDKSEVNVRLDNVCLEDLSFSSSSGFTLNVVHSGMSIFSKGGKQYLFTHRNVNNPNLTWNSSVSSDGDVHCSTSPFSEIILPETRNSSMKKFLIQPSGHTYLEVRVNGRAILDSASLKIRYEHM